VGDELAAGLGDCELVEEDEGEEDVLLDDEDPWCAPHVLATVVFGLGVGWGVAAGGLTAVEESSGALPAPVPVPTASSASTRASAVAREATANEAATPGPIAAPAAIPAASMAAARIALVLRGGRRGTLGGRGELIVQHKIHKISKADLLYEDYDRVFATGLSTSTETETSSP
jgi:hypothetical protein